MVQGLYKGGKRSCTRLSKVAAVCILVAPTVQMARFSKGSAPSSSYCPRWWFGAWGGFSVLKESCWVLSPLGLWALVQWETSAAHADPRAGLLAGDIPKEKGAQSKQKAATWASATLKPMFSKWPWARLAKKGCLEVENHIPFSAFLILREEIAKDLPH